MYYLRCIERDMFSGMNIFEGFASNDFTIKGQFSFIINSTLFKTSKLFLKQLNKFKRVIIFFSFTGLF